MAIVLKDSATLDNNSFDMKNNHQSSPNAPVEGSYIKPNTIVGESKGDSSVVDIDSLVFQEKAQYTSYVRDTPSSNVPTTHINIPTSNIPTIRSNTPISNAPYIPSPINNGIRSNVPRSNYPKANSPETLIEYVYSDIDISTLSEEDLIALIGQMTPEQYEEFINGVKLYYSNQIEVYKKLLNGYQNGNTHIMGYKDYQETIEEFIEDHQLLTHPVEDELNKYDWQINSLLDRYNYSYTPQWFSRDFPDGGITYYEFQNLSREKQKQFLIEQNNSEILEILGYQDHYINEIDDLVKEEFGDLGVNTYEELELLKQDVDDSVIQLNNAITMTEKLEKSAWYDYLPFLDAYNDYEMHEFTDEELETVKESKGEYYSDPYSYATFLTNNQNKNINPMDYILMVKQMNKSSDFELDPILGIKTEELKALAEVYDSNPEFAKTYSYLYELDPERAKQYLKDCQYEVNNIRGQLEAQEFLSGLGEKDGKFDALDAIANNLGVTTQGLMDGLISFGEGAYYTLEALGTALGICEENRTMTVQEYKKMYILQALLPQEAKEQAGLIVKNEDNTYENNVDVNPYGLIDYSKSYSGFWLNHKYSINQGIGNMIPSILMSTINPAAGMWTLGVSAGGNAYHSAMVDGKSYTNALFYGLFTGASEAITERLLGGLPGLSEVKVTSFGTYLKAMGREAFQESLQGTMDYLYKAMFMGEALPDITDVEGWKAIGKDIATQGIYGGITAGILQSPSLINVISTTRAVNNFFTDNNITLEQQEEAINQLRSSNPDYQNLSDLELKLLVIQNIELQAKIQKLALENNISEDIARIMLTQETDLETAKYMFEHQISLEEAEKAIKTKKFLDDYMHDPTIEIPEDIDSKLIDYLDRYRNDPDCTAPLGMPAIVIEYLEEYSVETFFGGKEEYTEFKNKVEQMKEQYRNELKNRRLYWTIIDNVKYNIADLTPAEIYALLDATIERISTDDDLLNNWPITSLEELEHYIKEEGDHQRLPDKLMKSLKQKYNTLYKNYCEEYTNLLIEKINSNSDIQLDVRMDDNNRIEFYNLEPNSVYHLKYNLLNKLGKDESIDIIIKTDSNGIGTSSECALTNALLSDLKYYNWDIQTFEQLYNESQIHAEEAAEKGLVQKSPYYQILADSEGLKIGIYQGCLHFLTKEAIQRVRAYLPTLSNADTIAYLRKVDSEGACSHAGTLNRFVLQWSNKQDLFREVFGFDMYRTEGDYQTLNQEALLADYYTYLNKDNKGLFQIDNDTITYLDPDTHEKQVYSSAKRFQEYLRWKMEKAGLDYDVTVTERQISSYNSKSPNNNAVPFEELQDILYKGIHEENKAYELSFWIDYDAGQKLIMYKYNPETGLHDKTRTTDEWFRYSSDYEKGLSKNQIPGHDTTILDVSDKGIYVQSWGDTYFIPYESLNNTEYSITSFTVDVTEKNENNDIIKETIA